jgi:hypothetical protein
MTYTYIYLYCTGQEEWALLTMAGVDQSLGGTLHNGQCRLVIGRNSSQWPVQTGHWEELLTMASADWSLGGTPHNGQFGPVIGRNSSQWLVSTSHQEECTPLNDWCM